MMSPLRPAEFLLALMIMSIVRLSIGMIRFRFWPSSFLGSISGRSVWRLRLSLQT
jgi:ABC-2 type transport system permease protein